MRFVSSIVLSTVALLVALTMGHSPASGGPLGAPAGTTERASVSSAGTEANGTSAAAAISADGRYVAFVSDAANLVAGDANNGCDIFLRDRVSGTTSRVSVDSAGNQTNGPNCDAGTTLGGPPPAISADGHYIAFASDATNLVAGDTNGVRDVFVHDRASGATTRVSVDSAGNQANGPSASTTSGNRAPPPPTISADGRFVGFVSFATNLDTTGAVPCAVLACPDVFVHDRQTGITTIVSLDNAGNQSNTISDYPAISADGRFVAFVCTFPSLGGGVCVRDLIAGQTEPIHVSCCAISETPSLSADGRYVAFYSSGNDLVAGDTNNEADIFVFDRQARTYERASVDSAGNQANGPSGPLGDGTGRGPVISADGRFVAFVSHATNLVVGDTNNSADILVRDRLTHETTRVSVDSLDHQGDGSSRLPAISADGRYVAFDSFSRNLVPSDTGNRLDVFVHDRQASAPASADLAVTKSDSPDPVASGTDIAYTIVVTNNGPGAATNAALSDPLPANTTFRSIGPVPAGWTCPSPPPVGGTGTLNCTNPTVTVGATSTFMLTVRVNVGTPNGTLITNTATVSSAVADPNAGNNSASATTAVSAPPTQCPPPPPPIAFGQTISCSIDAPGEADNFTFDAVNGDDVRIRLSATSGNLLARISVHFGGTPVPGCLAGDLSFLDDDTCTLTNNRTHTLRVAGVGGTTGNYNVALQRLNNPLDAPNCPRIDFGALVSGALVPTEMECHTFDALAGDDVRARLQRTSGDLVANLRLYRPDGSLVTGCTGTSGDLSSLDLTCALTAGTHSLVAASYSATAGNHNVALQRLNNPLGTPNCPRIDVGPPPVSDSLVPAEMACYTFDAQAGRSVLAEFDRTSGNLIARLTVYRPDGSAMPGCTAGDLSSLDLTCPLDTTGTHSLLVAGFGMGDYTVLLTCQTLPCGPGGTGFRLSGWPSGAVMVWEGGTGQSGYAVLRLVRGVPSFPAGCVLPPGATGCTDPAPVRNQFNCYVLLILRPAPAGPLLSDLLCLVPNTKTGTPPREFRVRLDQSPITTAEWRGPAGGGQTDYQFHAIPLDGTDAQTIDLPAGATSATHDTLDKPTCYVLVARTDLGNTDFTCAIPGVATVSAASTASSAAPGRSVAPDASVAAAVARASAASQGLDTAAERVRSGRPALDRGTPAEPARREVPDD
jgi:uncharacterized repeat protein (TIGR01451 family)